MKSKYPSIILLLVGAFFVASSHAKPVSFASVTEDFHSNPAFYASLGLDRDLIHSFQSHPALREIIHTQGATNVDDTAFTHDPVADYVTVLPHDSQPTISWFEKAVLTAYLDNPNDRVLAEFLAIYHLKDSLVINKKGKGQALKHTVIAQYFLHRTQDLGNNNRWVDKALRKTDKALDKLFSKGHGIDAAEDRAAHTYFYEAFNYHEENRYIASAKLLNDFVENPNSIFTSFLIMSAHVWIGGEADYDDPTILYDFALAGYFSVHTITTAQQMELAWVADPVNNHRFRLAPILGGLSALERRWLAQLHGDTNAMALIDEEHRQWRLLHPKFHGFTVGVTFFEEEANFFEGFMAWSEMIDLAGCEGMRTCLDRPRFSFNLLGVFLGYSDYLLKIGATNDAQMFLTFRYNPAFGFNEWDLGRDAWLQRENNLQQIADLYANGNPDDDPKNFFLNEKQWSANTSTCQACHQAQSRVWTEEEKATVMPLRDDILTIGDWPAISTSWYGSASN